MAAEPSALIQPPLVAEQVPRAHTPELRARFERMYRELAPYVLRVLPRMGVAERDLDDVLQEVFLAVHRALPSFEGRSSERTWLYGICMRTCSNYRQRAHRWRERMPGDLPDDGHEQTPERTLANSAALRKLDAALASLPEVQREAFVLFEIEQLTVSEIAEALGCSKFTVYTRLYRGRAAVQAQMRESSGEEKGHA